MARRRKSRANSAARRTRKPRTPDVPGTARAHVGETFARSTNERLPQSGPHSDGGAMPVIDLNGQVSGNAHLGLLDVVLEVVGAEHLTLRETLGLWQREQDRIVNRAWRRPGGLMRPAGL
jgi:hypothetical protein